MDHAWIDVSWMPPAIPGLSSRARFLLRPQLLTRTSAPPREGHGAIRRISSSPAHAAVYLYLAGHACRPKTWSQAPVSPLCEGAFPW